MALEIFLPDRAWLLRLRDDIEQDDEDSPLSDYGEEDNFYPLDDEGYFHPDLLIDGPFNGWALSLDDRFSRVKEAFWMNCEDIPHDEESEGEFKGRFFEQCMGSGYVYKTYD